MSGQYFYLAETYYTDGSLIGDADALLSLTQFQSFDGSQETWQVLIFDAPDGSDAASPGPAFGTAALRDRGSELSSATAGATDDLAPGSSDLTQFQSLDMSFDSARGNSPGPAFVLDPFGSADISNPGSASVWPGHGGASPAHDPIGDITPIDSDFSAKGSKVGGSGGGGGGGVLTQYFAGSANGTAGYDIWIEFKGSGWTADLQKAFINSADYFTQVVTDDIGGGGIYRGKVIDDLYVSAEVKSIDGPGGILGQAGPTAIWTTTELTAAGMMQFDVADASNYFKQGLWDDIVTHELMHVLGFGSLWNYGTNPLVSGNQYKGPNALAAYQELHPGATYIPVEDSGGSGTAGSHWDEGALKNELMTGYINNDGNPSTVTDNYLSKFSVESLADLGYHVGYKDYPYDGILIA